MKQRGTNKINKINNIIKRWLGINELNDLYNDINKSIADNKNRYNKLFIRNERNLANAIQTYDKIFDDINDRIDNNELELQDHTKALLKLQRIVDVETINGNNLNTNLGSVPEDLIELFEHNKQLIKVDRIVKDVYNACNYAIKYGSYINKSDIKDIVLKHINLNN